MEDKTVWDIFTDIFDSSNLTEWLQSIDVVPFIYFTCGVTLLYLVMNTALRIMSALFWPAAIIIGLLFFRNENFAALVTEQVQHISQAAMSEILPVQEE
uniref:Uncharacterized protein n=1 Tax=Anopheles minimus TaxID=112268 RepID=A0A182WQX4_9DIPT